MKITWQKTLDWHDKFRPIAKDISQELSLGTVRNALNRLRVSIESLEGQHNLYNAKLFRQWKSAEGEDFITVARKIRKEKTLLWPRSIQAAKRETGELARLV